jgi:hypothetical protein
MDCFLVMAKYEDSTKWIISAHGTCDELERLGCYQDPPETVVPKAGNPATLVKDVRKGNCRGGPLDDGNIYRWQQ